VCAMHTTLRRGFFVLLNSHFKLLRLIQSTLSEGSVFLVSRPAQLRQRREGRRAVVLSAG
jgi:hypothetical protein